ncbi:MAG TPA: M55 family metallopeptidase, partial [Candidatus Cloacimonadota bacterium]|nr:M55 family metallopeptidase [Candidatus Cloacimonadota bacterium]
MKIYISLDMEGIPGTYNWEHENVDRAAVKTCMYKHLGDVVDGLLHSHKDVREIVIADSHRGGDNIGYDFTERDERITLISGTPRSQYMMPALNEDFDRVFLIGYHAGTGSIFGSMDHTYANKRIHKIWINDQPMNEAIINAAYAGFKKVPVTLVSGDWALQEELMADNALPWVDYIATK